MKYRNFNFLLFEISLAILLTACTTHSTSDINPLIDVKTSFSVGNYELASEQLLPLANEGNSEAEYSLGYLFYYGLGVEQDKELAREWFRRSAKQQNMKAVAALTVIGQRQSVFAPLPEAHRLDDIEVQPVAEEY